MTDSEKNSITCPFCGESDFDLSGLKGHFLSGDCQIYNNTETPVRRFL
jgi:hypothetical protein